MTTLETLKRYDLIFWDFDGVLLDSMAIRDQGFVEVLEAYPKDQVSALVDYHRENGGLSRYHKFRYFFEQIRQEAVTAGQITDLAKRFSVVMKKLLVNPDLLIAETVSWAKECQNHARQFIVSGSDQKELRFLTKELNIDPFFNGIYGSPTPKKELVLHLLKLEQVDNKNVCLIGDSVNDYEAATANSVDFLGFNSSVLSNIEGVKMIEM